MKAVSTKDAPEALGPYSQAIKCGNTIYTAGQIGLDPKTMTLVEEPEKQIRRVFDNLRAICVAAGADLDRIARLTVYLPDLAHWPIVNEVMKEYFDVPFPARSAVGIAVLPLNAVVEVDAIIVLADA